MVYHSRYRQIEERYGLPMREILAKLLNEHRVNKVAEILGVHRKTVNEWAELAGLKRCYVIADDCAVERADARAEQR